MLIIIAIISIVLILFVLVQNPKGGGLNSEFGSVTQLGGAKRTTDILEKITWGLAIALVLLTLSTSLIIEEPTVEGLSSPNIDRAQERTVLPSIDPNLESGTLDSDSTGE